MYSDVHPSHSSFINQDIESLKSRIDILYVYSHRCNCHDPNDLIRLAPFKFRSLGSRINWRLEHLGLPFRYKNESFSKKLNEHLQLLQPQVIHCQFAYEGLKVWDNVPERARYQWIFSFRGYDASSKMRNKAYRLRIRQILSLPNVHAFFVCDYLKSNMIGLGIPLSRSHVVYTGIDTDYFQKRTDFDGMNKRIIQVGAFNEKKGQEITIRAFRDMIVRFKMHDIQLVFVGSGPLEQRCRQLAKSIGLQHRIHFLGALNREQVRAELEKASLFVHHSITPPNGDTEGIPNSLCEAMAMELPVVATRHAGIPELLNMKTRGNLVEEFDIPSYATAMFKWVNYGRAQENRERIVTNFSLSKHIKELMRFYQLVSNQGNRKQ